jgi:hypothetical protein
VYNIALAVRILAIFLPARRRIGTDVWLYALATWGMTMCMYQSTGRYMLAVFPAFIALAFWQFPPRIRPHIFLLLFGLTGGFAILIAHGLALWSFVA